MAIAAKGGIGLGMVTLTLFLFSLSQNLAFGFLIGAAILNIFTGIEEVPVRDSESPE
jgi:hypothetical protein